ncbi:MAG: sugar phosphate isomerase/epimerase family protein, partial [Armatimonadota bacterium]
DCVKRVLAATEGSNVDIGVENHGWGGNDPAFIDGALERVGSDRFGVTLDTGNFYWRGHPLDEVYAVMERLAPFAKHTHVKAISYPGEIRNQERECGFEYGKYVCPIAEGDIDHTRVIEWLKAAGYERSFCLEDESLGKVPQEDRAVVLAADAEYCRGIL